MMSAFKKIGAAVGTYLAVDKIVSFGKSCVEAAATVQAQNAQFEATFKDLGGTAKEMFQNISNDTGVLATRLQTVGTGAFSQFKGAGLDAAEALKKTGKYTNLAADAAAYYDMSLEEADSLMRSFIRGNTEAGDRIGLFTSETQRNEYALNKLGKKYLDCTEAEKQMIMLDIASNIYESSGAMGQASREADGYENVVGNLKEAWKQFTAAIGQPILEKVVPILQNITKKLLGMQDTVKQGIDWFNKYKGTIAAIAGVIGILTTAIGLQNVVQAVKSAMNAAEATSLGALIAAKWADVAATAAMLAPYVAIVAAIAAVAAGVIYCYNNFETFRNVVNGVAEWITTGLTAAFDFLRQYIESIISAVGTLVSAIGNGLIQAFQWIIDKITEVYNSSSPIVEAIKTLFFTHFENIKICISTVFNVIKTVIQTVMTVIKQIIQTITAAIKGDWSGVWNGIKSIFSTIWNAIKSIVSTVLNGIKSVISNVLNAAKSIVSNVLNGIKSVFTSIWNSIKSKVSSVINGIKSTISGGLNSAKSTVSSVLGAIKSKFSDVFEGAKNIVRNAINKIKGFFNFSWSLPPIKLPHFHIDGKFSLNPPSIPHFSVDWYKKAMDTPMMFTEPTIFGMNPATGQMKGAGEAGDEVMIGKNTMLNMIQTAVAMEIGNFAELLQKIVDILLEFFPQLADGQNIVLDDGTLVGRMSYGMDKELGDINRLKERGA